ncbi:hypothetical protein [Legionella pneumophila]|uniref:hypothetical protein n=1 Tax=Legionella pneumophila TaxID=446 RepID=UPI0038D07766
MRQIMGYALKNNQHLQMVFCRQTLVRYPLSVIRYPLSVIRYPLSVIRYPLSSLVFYYFPFVTTVYYCPGLLSGFLHRFTFSLIRHVQAQGG